jgi:hypothetical protein
MNIRTETPGTPQPVGRMQNETAPQSAPRYQPEENLRAEAPARVAERPVPRPSSPLVRTAPPVEERPALQRSEQQKFSDWQQQRQQKAAPARSSAPSHSEPAHASEHSKNK